MPPSSPSSPGPVVFINLWPEGGMRHYSESVVHALGSTTDVFYLRNYPTATSAKGQQVACDFHPLRLRNWLALFRIAVLLVRLRPRAVHLNNEQPLLLPLYPLLSRWNPVITLHDARSHDGESLLKRLFHRFHVRMVSLFIPKVIVHSAAIRDALPDWFPRARVFIVPHVNYRLWAQAAPNDPLPDDPLSVLFFGRILPYKGLDLLLEAFALLDPARFHLRIMGEGAVPPVNAPNIEVDNRFVSDDRLGACFQQAHVIALPYRAASQSGVAHLAHAFGKPVVATRVGALPEAIADGRTGLLVPPRDPQALAEAFRRLADPALRRTMEEAIRQENVGSDESIRELLLQIYDA